VEEEAIRQ